MGCICDINLFYCIPFIPGIVGCFLILATVRGARFYQARKRLYGIASFGWSGSTKH
jgi:molybdopterin-containing oxidoreductase family membrane subunit